MKSCTVYFSQKQTLLVYKYIILLNEKMHTFKPKHFSLDNMEVSLICKVKMYSVDMVSIVLSWATHMFSTHTHTHAYIHTYLAIGKTP